MSILVKTFFYAALAAVFTFVPLRPVVAAQGAPLRIAVENSYKPFSYVDEEGRRTGFDVDIVKAVCAAMQRECEIIPMPFNDILAAVAEGKADIGALGFGITPERQNVVDFTDHYFRSPSIFIEKPGTVKSLSPEDLTGKRVGTQPGTIQEAYLHATYGTRITLVPTPNFEELFEKLQAGGTDIILVDGLPGYAVLKSPLGTGLETLGPPVPGNLVNTSAHMIVPKGRQQLREDINKSIREIVRNGEYAKINRKYFEFNVY